MANEKDLQIQALLNATGKTGPELTHGLRELGSGKMADGLVELWKAGQHNGVVKGATITTMLFTAAIGGFILIKNKIEDREMKRVLEEIEASDLCPDVNTETESTDKMIPNVAPREVDNDEGQKLI